MKLEPKPVMWILGEALTFIRELNELTVPVGFYCGLTGSVLFKGQSTSDLDVILYPTTTANIDLEALHECFRKAGFTQAFTRGTVAKMWERKGSLDQKSVDVWFTPLSKKRVDFFYLK